jgi:TIR domain
MPTKFFISWSGPLSQKLGEALRNWLPSALQFVKPYFSPEDIEKGAKWSSEISVELDTSNIGIICLTRDNTEKPWILFEAGALSKSLEKGRVCTLLFDLEPSDIEGPLTSFQGTRFRREDFKRLVITINSAAGDSGLEPQVLDDVFNMWWPKLEDEITKIIQSSDQVAKEELRTDRDILKELLELARMNSSSGLVQDMAIIKRELLRDRNLNISTGDFRMLDLRASGLASAAGLAAVSGISAPIPGGTT